MQWFTKRTVGVMVVLFLLGVGGALSRGQLAPGYLFGTAIGAVLWTLAGKWLYTVVTGQHESTARADADGAS